MRTVFLVAALGLLCSAPQKANAQTYGGPSGRAGSMSSTPYPASSQGPPVVYVVVLYPASRSARSAPVSIGAYDNSFTPRTLYVPVGATVVWTNHGRHTHTVTADDSSWGSGDLAPDRSYAVMFTLPGKFHYHCGHHKGMKGTVVVGSGTGY